MRLTDLTPGHIFPLEGGLFETKYVSPSGRIVMAYVLDDVAKRVPDPEDLTGDAYLTTVFSDLRFNREHETPEDLELDDLL